MLTIKKAAVLGAGTMGAAIAAHLSNAGIPTLLLDIAPKELSRGTTKRKACRSTRRRFAIASSIRCLKRRKN